MCGLRHVDARGHRGALEEGDGILRVGWGDTELSLEVRHADTIEAAPNTVAHTALEAIACADEIANRLVVTAQLEPCRRVPGACGGLKVPEGVPWRGWEDGGKPRATRAGRGPRRCRREGDAGGTLGSRWW